MSEFFSKWKSGLSRTSKSAFGRLAGLLGATDISEETWDELEDLLIQADMGVDVAGSVLASLKEEVKQKGIVKSADLRPMLKVELRSRLESPPPLDFLTKPSIILLVGVNGSGKTTTASKLGKRYQSEGKSILFGAADTFRAAAADQLQVWGDRLGIPVVTGASESDPGAVVFNTVQSGISRGVDLILIDTAGRLHTRYNLMEELKKMYRVAGKAMEGAPHHVWLVLDATIGQNALHQARTFKDAVKVTGIILSKLDSSSRGGMAFAIHGELDLPILFAGLGERPEDLTPFDPDAFIDGILGS
jgi:fused signal recognition particle receptor